VLVIYSDFFLLAITSRTPPSTISDDNSNLMVIGSRAKITPPTAAKMGTNNCTTAAFILDKLGSAAYQIA
jgi:hypothetical protein